MELKNYNKIFVTGATGLVGAHVVSELLKAGKQVGVSYRNKKSLENLLREVQNVGLESNFESYEVDLCSYEPLRDVLCGYDAVVHAAANVDLSKNSKKYINSNLNITKAVVWSAVNAKIKRFVHISSIATLGEPNYGAKAIDETSNLVSLVGKSGYTKSKFYCENEVFRAFNEGLNGVIVNPAVIIGWNKQNSGSSRVVSMLARKNKFYASGVTGYVGVCDVARAVVVLLDSEISSKRMVLCSENLSYCELMSKSAEIVGVKAPKIQIADSLVKILMKFLRFTEKLGIRMNVSSSMLTNLVSKMYYDGSMITKCTNFQYTPISQQLETSINAYLSTKNK